MPAFLHSLTTHVPDYQRSQEELRDQLEDRFADKRYRRLVRQAFRMSGIEKRNLVTPAFFDCAPFDSEGNAPTAARNTVYATESRRLAVELGEKILAQPDAVHRDEITHVIFVTCTGFVNPGPDFFLVKDLSLPENVERYTIGFMGCYGAFPAMRMASQFCEADPDAKVLVVCLELCSLHMRLDESPDAILGNTVFSDGVAGGIISAQPASGEKCYALKRFATATIPEGESSMAWSIGNDGFDLVLSSYVPKVISAEIGSVLERTGHSKSEIDQFAVHPGGKAILDRVQESLELPEDALAASREVLRNFGNMSSPTILFVLKELLEASMVGDKTLAIAFGPGLTVETAGLKVTG